MILDPAMEFEVPALGRRRHLASTGNLDGDGFRLHGIRGSGTLRDEACPVVGTAGLVSHRGDKRVC